MSNYGSIAPTAGPGTTAAGGTNMELLQKNGATRDEAGTVGKAAGSDRIGNGDGKSSFLAPDGGVTEGDASGSLYLNADSKTPLTPAEDSDSGNRGLCSCLSSGCRECCKDLHDFGEEIKTKCAGFDCKACMGSCCSKQALQRKVPIIRWLPSYRLPHLQGDLIAGLTVGLTVIPQGIAYAQVAELPPQYGLYSAFMGCFIYCVLGTSKDITLGPTAIMSLMTAQFGKSWFPEDPTVAIVLTMISGFTQFLMGLLHIGFLVDYISYPVINSFTTAASITIAFGQIKKWLGLQDVSREFLHQVYDTFSKLPETNIWDCILGACCMIILYGMKRMKNIKWNETQEQSTGQRVGRKIIWLLGTARNALIVVITGALVAILISFDIDELSITGEIKPGLPPFKFPDFSVTGPAPGVGNETSNATITYGPSDIFSKIGSGFIIVPIIGLVETIAIGKAFARKNKYKIDASQELIAIGASNVISSFVGSYPVTGSFSRTAVNSQSGVRTPAGGIWTAGLVLLALGVLTPLFKYIPDAALAAVIIMAVLDMADFSMLRRLWRVKRVDLVPWLATFIFSFILGIEYGIMVGVGLCLLMLLYPAARPRVDIKEGDSENRMSTQEETVEKRLAILVLDSGFKYPGVEYVKEKVLAKALEEDVPRSIILDMRHVSGLDFGAVSGLTHLNEDLRVHGLMMAITNLQPPVRDVCMRAELGNLRVCDDNEQAIRAILDELPPNIDNPREGLLASGDNLGPPDGDLEVDQTEKPSLEPNPV